MLCLRAACSVNIKDVRLSGEIGQICGRGELFLDQSIIVG